MSRIASTSSSPARAATAAAGLEPLESRRLFAAPHATSIISDNRGEVLITLDADVVPSTVSGRSVQMHVPGADGVFGTADDQKVQARVRWSAGNKRITIKTDNLPVNSIYSVKVTARLVKAADGTKLDGEFNGPGLRSGNDVAAGDLLFVSKRDKGAQPVARFSTVAGAINVKLFRDTKPITVSNFLAYANAGAWDGTFLHRSAHLDAQNTQPFVVQGGGFKVSPSNTLVEVGANAAIKNEPGISNTRGTIAMAKLGAGPDPINSATNQWFFNEANNSGPPASLDQQNGGFTVFGEITNASGLAVMDAIGALPKKDFTSAQPSKVTGAMDDTPVVNANSTPGTLNPAADLVVIRRIAILNKVSAYVIG